MVVRRFQRTGIRLRLRSFSAPSANAEALEATRHAQQEMVSELTT
jgi:hypothetical protein